MVRRWRRMALERCQEAAEAVEPLQGLPETPFARVRRGDAVLGDPRRRPGFVGPV